MCRVAECVSSVSYSILEDMSVQELEALPSRWYHLLLSLLNPSDFATVYKHGNLETIVFASSTSSTTHIGSHGLWIDSPCAWLVNRKALMGPFCLEKDGLKLQSLHV